jgi:hypothetical protein
MKEVAVSAAPHHAMGRDAAVYRPPRPGPLHHLPRERQLQQEREAVSSQPWSEDQGRPPSRPKKHKATGTGGLFRARRHQVINTRQELVQLAGKINWDFIDGEIAPRAAVQRQWSAWNCGVCDRLFLLKHILAWMIAGTNGRIMSRQTATLPRR